MTYPFPPPFVQVRPKMPGAVASLVLGILAVAGTFLLIVPVFLAPLAWYHGAAARRRIEREPDRWSGAGEARAGLVLGIVGSVLMIMVLGVLLLIALGVSLVAGYDAGYGS